MNLGKRERFSQVYEFIPSFLCHLLMVEWVARRVAPFVVLEASDNWILSFSGTRPRR
jgi:hypothetical protein